jgi:hypothetical protein
VSKILDEILQALQNLGGQASSREIIDAVEQLRSTKLSEKERENFNTYLHVYSTRFKSPNGQPYFYKVGTGTWAITDGNYNVAWDVSVDSPKKKQLFDTGAVSFETIVNCLRTIKEYRDYYDPLGSNWAEYIYEIFHVLGFNTESIDSRLFFLKEMGTVTPEAIVLCSFPGEDSTSIAPGISWDSHLRFAASYLGVKWGILTNGLKLQVFNYGTSKNNPLLSWPDLDAIIRDQNMERFFSIYKTFSSFRSQIEGSQENEVARHKLRLEFWKGLLDQAKFSLPRFYNLTPGRENWISVGAGKTGFNYIFAIRMTEAEVPLYIDQGDAKRNKHFFDALYAHREQIEKAFGQALDWQRLDAKRASRVSYVIDNSGLLARDSWPALQKQMIDAMAQLQKAFGREISKLK